MKATKNKKYKKGGLADIGLGLADMTANTLGIDVIKNDMYNTKWGSKVGEIGSAITKTAAPIVANSLLGPAGGMAVSGIQQVAGSMIQQDPNKSETGKYADQFAGIAGSLTGQLMGGNTPKPATFKMGGSRGQYDLIDFKGPLHEEGGIKIMETGGQAGSSIEVEGGEKMIGNTILSNSIKYTKNMIDFLNSQGIKIDPSAEGKTQAKYAKSIDKKKLKVNDIFTKNTEQISNQPGRGGNADLQRASDILGKIFNPDAEGYDPANEQLGKQLLSKGKYDLGGRLNPSKVNRLDDKHNPFLYLQKPLQFANEFKNGGTSGPPVNPKKEKEKAEATGTGAKLKGELLNNVGDALDNFPTISAKEYGNVYEGIDKAIKKSPYNTIYTEQPNVQGINYMNDLVKRVNKSYTENKEDIFKTLDPKVGFLDKIKTLRNNVEFYQDDIDSISKYAPEVYNQYSSKFKLAKPLLRKREGSFLDLFFKDGGKFPEGGTPWLDDSGNYVQPTGKVLDSFTKDQWKQYNDFMSKYDVQKRKDALFTKDVNQLISKPYNDKISQSIHALTNYKPDLNKFKQNVKDTYGLDSTTSNYHTNESGVIDAGQYSGLFPNEAAELNKYQWEDFNKKKYPEGGSTGTVSNIQTPEIPLLGSGMATAPHSMNTYQMNKKYSFEQLPQYPLYEAFERNVDDTYSVDADKLVDAHKDVRKILMEDIMTKGNMAAENALKEYSKATKMGDTKKANTLKSNILNYENTAMDYDPYYAHYKNGGTRKFKLNGTTGDPVKYKDVVDNPALYTQLKQGDTIPTGYIPIEVSDGPKGWNFYKNPGSNFSKTSYDSTKKQMFSDEYWENFVLKELKKGKEPTGLRPGFVENVKKKHNITTPNQYAGMPGNTMKPIDAPSTIEDVREPVEEDYQLEKVNEPTKRNPYNLLAATAGAANVGLSALANLKKVNPQQVGYNIYNPAYEGLNRVPFDMASANIANSARQMASTSGSYLSNMLAGTSSIANAQSQAYQDILSRNVDRRNRGSEINLDAKTQADYYNAGQKGRADMVNMQNRQDFLADVSSNINSVIGNLDAQNQEASRVATMNQMYPDYKVDYQRHLFKSPEYNLSEGNLLKGKYGGLLLKKNMKCGGTLKSKK